MAASLKCGRAGLTCPAARNLCTRCKTWHWGAQVIPLMQQLRQGGLMGNLEELTRSASAAATDIHRLQNEVCHTVSLQEFGRAALCGAVVEL